MKQKLETVKEFLKRGGKIKQLPEEIECNIIPIEEKITRNDCRVYLEDRGFINVKKSSCVFCPYHSNEQWKEIKTNYPEEWKKVLKVDNKIRDLTKKGIKDKLYLHSSRKPIEEAYLQEDQEELFMCEEGYCGI